MFAFTERNSTRLLIAAAVRQTFVHACQETSHLRRLALRALLIVGIVATMLMTGGSAPDAHSRTTQVTWTADVEPIISTRCVRCHQANGFAPMPLPSYHEARAWASAIRTEVLSARMPPWPAAPGYGEFSNDAHLSAIETGLVARSADGGAPLGPVVVKASVVAAPARGESMHIALPPLIAPAAGRRVALPTVSDRNRWLSAWTFEPGDRSLVEEATLSVNGTMVSSWTAFDDRIVYPQHTGDRIARGDAVSVAVRYRKTSAPIVDRSAITLYFDSKPPHELHHLVAGCGQQVFDRDVDLLAVKPIAAAAGDPIEVVVFGRDGAVTPVCVVSRYRPEYPITYRMRTPIRLARGSRVEVRSSSPGCSAAFDFVNSAVR